MKNILLLVHDDPAQEARYQVALDIARAVGGHLKCLEVEVLPPVVLEPLWAEDEASLAGSLLPAESLKERLTREDVPWDWMSVTGDIGPALAEAARLADLIVLSLPESARPGPITIPLVTRLVAATRRPVFLVPAAGASVDLAAPALVAWDGSIGASSALGAAIPLLVHTGEAVILEIGREAVDVSAEEAAAYLSRHGVRASVQLRPAGRRSVGELVARIAAKGGFGYIVMGSFGHSPLRAALFGSVTRTLLERSRTAVFLSR